MSNTEQWLKRYDESVASVLPKVFDIVADVGVGCWIFDVDGRAYLDLTSGIGAVSVGHCNPDVTRAINYQANRLVHTSVVTRHTGYIQVAENLGKRCPFFEHPNVFLTNSGTEAVEGALKLSRRVTGHKGVLSFSGQFHGRSTGSTALTTAKTKYRSYLDLADWAYTGLPYGFPPEDVEKSILNSRIQPWTKHKITAVLVEPVLGEGGFVVPPPNWLKDLRTVCDNTDTLLVFDEVQTFGRTGSYWAAETFDVVPDILLFAKAVANGMPLGGIIAEKSLMSVWESGMHGSTYGGNPLSCAAALATLEILDLCMENVHQLGTYARDRLAQALPSFPVRGVGLMIGVECPSGAFVEAVQAECQRLGLLVLSCGPHGEVLRIMPSLTIEFEELSHGLRILIDAIRKEQEK